MFCIVLNGKLMVQDFTLYKHEFPFKDPSCLTRCTDEIQKHMSVMRTEDAHDDTLVAEEVALQVHTRAQLRNAQDAAASNMQAMLATLLMMPMMMTALMCQLHCPRGQMQF